ncbi:transcriptional regulator [Anaerocolumna chitinilytica]|uniref:Transcriptional regulator n=2 Tax=Anaerocolumna chitinilytica TaxID=1727145 RepID=A0A7M3S9I7_9FIRM|nr:helix-turn-helix transcriptional regulator [Anaerocolumna chitinilytica]BCK01255.1 transcriptional regulator [Anaerocolumna chitinilytica]
MELSTQIKKYRNNMNLSQEELAEKVYVTRQTISNWENNKNYPDIHSLLLLSTLFNISLDQLIKGDIAIMKEEIKKSEIEKLNHYGNIFTLLLLITMVSVVPLAVFLHFYGMIIFGVLFAFTMYFAFKVERCKKDNDVQTFKEIVAFAEGKRLDEIEKYQEAGKRPYQKVLLVIGSAVITLIVCCLLLWVLKPFIV